MWICDLILYLKLEKIKYFKKLFFHKIWEPMITYLEKMKNL